MKILLQDNNKMIGQPTFGTFASSNTQADDSACKRAKFLSITVFPKNLFDYIYLLYLSSNDKYKFASPIMKSFGEYIRKLRTQNNLTLTQLAAMLDLDSANLSKIENGKRDFDDKRLVKLAIALKLNIDEVKKEYYSDFIAKKIYESDCKKDTLLLAEEKVEYLKQKEIKQGKINF